MFTFIAAMERKRYSAVRLDIIKRLEDQGYTTYWEILNTKSQGIPQSRPRFYLVAITEPKYPFEFPPPIESEPLNAFLDADPRVHDHEKAKIARTTFKKAHQHAVKKWARLGVNYKETDIVMDANASPSWACSMVRCSPCLTASRCRVGGHYLLSRRRFMTWQEVCRLQGLPPARVDFQSAGVKLSDFRHAVGTP